MELLTIQQAAAQMNVSSHKLFTVLRTIGWVDCKNHPMVAIVDAGQMSSHHSRRYVKNIGRWVDYHRPLLTQEGFTELQSMQRQFPALFG